MSWLWNPKTKDSGIITCLPQTSDKKCPTICDDCFFWTGRSYLEPLAENLPHIPPIELTKGRVVRLNDGIDSNIDRLECERVANLFDDAFFNTAIPSRLSEFSRPVVVTVNPGELTDEDFNHIPVEQEGSNLMFVRVRTNTWNIEEVVDPAVQYYTNLGVPVVLTYMAYYTQVISNDHIRNYDEQVRTVNSYYCLRNKPREEIEERYIRNGLVYTCGWKGGHSCSGCGNCLREYYNAKERMRNDNE